jgi:nucleotide-binding universal stress UspA family protein
MDKPTLLVAVDFTECSDAALEFALALAPSLGAELELLHVVALPVASPAEIIAPAPMDDFAMREARAQLADLVQRAVDRGVPARAQLAVGQPVFGILDEITRTRPLFAIVGSHGKRGLRRVLLGSVSEALCRASAAPVVVVPPPRRLLAGARVAWSCDACGHILGDGESTETCAGCARTPVRWNAAPIPDGPADQAEPAVADSAGERLAYERTNDPVGLFATSPAGTEGYDVNPELRVRY